MYFFEQGQSCTLYIPVNEWLLHVGSMVRLFRLNSSIVGIYKGNMYCKCEHSHVCIYKIKTVSSHPAQYQIIRIGQSGFQFTLWQTCSVQQHLDFSWKLPAMLQLIHENYTYI